MYRILIPDSSIQPSGAGARCRARFRLLSSGR